jgi:hypothetical protein
LNSSLQREQHIGERRDEQRAAVDRQRGEAERDVEQDHDQAFADRRIAVVEAEQGEDRVDDHRRGQQVQPEGDVGAAGEARAVRRIPPHREQEHADAEQQHEAEDDVLACSAFCPSAATSRPTAIAGDRGGAGGDGDRHPEALPVQPGGGGGDRGGNAATMPPSCGLLSSASGPDASTSANAGGREDAADEASSSRIEGSAMRRLAVKNSARPQAVAATAAAPGRRAVAIDRSGRRLADLWPIQPTANSRIARRSTRRCR